MPTTRETDERGWTYVLTTPEPLEKELEARERSRRNIAKTSKYEVKFLGTFKNGMVWNNSNEPFLDLKEGVFHIVGGSKTSTHLIPVGGTMWDRFSVPKKLVKVIRLVRE